MRWFLGLVLTVSVASAVAAAEPLTDHPLLSAYQGSQIRNKEVKEFDEYRAFVGLDDAGAPTGPTLEGTVTQLFYKNPPERSVLEIFRNYETALQSSGAEILHQCDQRKLECVERYAQRVLGDYNGIQVISNNDGRYIIGKLTNEDKIAYLAVSVGPSFTKIDVVEVKAMDTGLVAVNAEVLGEGLDQKGYVIVEGIFFDTDKSTLKPESKPALDEVAKLLAARPGLKLYVVGHTDMQGSLSHNMTLSQGRAQAVVAALTTDYGIAAERLEGHGVGPLAPQASNAGEAGRAQNRRVVLVGR